MADSFQGPSATRVLAPDSSLRLVPAHQTLVLTPDLDYGTNWSYATPLNAVDGSDSTSAGANAGGGTASPSYRPAIRFTFDNVAKGDSAIVGCQIIYTWTNNSPGTETGARLDLYWQHPLPGIANEYDHRLMHQWGDLSFLDGVKTTEQYHFEGVTPPISSRKGETDVTLQHLSGISGSSNLTLLIFDFQFLIQDRVTPVNQG